MERAIFNTTLIYFVTFLSLQAQQYTFETVQIKDITKENESDWQASQVRAKIIALSHQRFEIELFDNPTRETPTLSYEVKHLSTDSNVHRYSIIMLNGIQLVNPGAGDIIETNTPLEKMAKGEPGTIAINEDVLEEIVVYKVE